MIRKYTMSDHNTVSFSWFIIKFVIWILEFDLLGCNEELENSNYINLKQSIEKVFEILTFQYSEEL